MLKSVTVCPEASSIVSLVAPRETVTCPWAFVVTPNKTLRQPDHLRQTGLAGPQKEHRILTRC